MSEEKKETRIKLEDLPAEEKELSAEEAKDVKGGAWHELVILGDVAAADGSVKPQEVTAPRDPASGLPTGKR
jgi:hypothetical protein